MALVHAHKRVRKAQGAWAGHDSCSEVEEVSLALTSLTPSTFLTTRLSPHADRVRK